MKLHKKLFATGVVATSLLTFTACNDFLELEPPSNVTPESYFQNDEQLGAYAIGRYNDIFTTPSGWGQGSIINGDAGTDNMAATAPNTSRFTKDLWMVGYSGDLGMGLIRTCNYFFQQVLPRYESGFYASYPNAEHYIGEMYFIRAWVYFSRLKTYGDYPIVSEVVTDNKEDLMAHGKRMPRNEVADFILSDLDKAISMLNDKGFLSNNRINKQVALLVKSRVALYEASYEENHRGTGRVPGDAGWPGFRVHPDYSFDVDAHINDLLTQATDAAKQVADNIQLTENTMVLDQNPASPGTGWNPYFEMYASMDLSGVDEVLMWRQYGTALNSSALVQHGVPAYIASSGGIGLLKGYVESFLMANGLPIYAAGSGYQGDVTIDNVKADRDGRLQLFVFGESNYLPFTTNNRETIYNFTPVLAPTRTDQMGDVTGYRIRKGESFDWEQNSFGDGKSETAQIVFRGTEALLNYIEAQYMRDGNLDATSQNYWRAIRSRAGVDTDFQKTINATNMSEEAKGDWGAYSKGTLIDPTMYNIRRERRCEFVGEGFRWDDLVRWCSMDQLVNNPYMPEGVNFWTSMYQTAIYTEMHTEASYVEGPTDPDANISSREESVYVRPYRKASGNPVFDGYTWMNAHYNSPLPIREIQLLSPDESVDNSVLYQTWGWPTESSMPAEK